MISNCVGIITCGADKRNYKCCAYDMYKGSLFVAARKFVSSNYKNWCILSAKYHVLLPTDIIEPYDLYLGDLTEQERQGWSNITAKQLLDKFPKNMVYHFYTGKQYVDGVLPILQNAGRSCQCYLNELGMGYKIQWFNQHVKITKKRKLF